MTAAIKAVVSTAGAKNASHCCLLILAGWFPCGLKFLAARKMFESVNGPKDSCSKYKYIHLIFGLQSEFPISIAQGTLDETQEIKALDVFWPSECQNTTPARTVG